MNRFLFVVVCLSSAAIALPADATKMRKEGEVKEK